MTSDCRRFVNKDCDNSEMGALHWHCIARHGIAWHGPFNPTLVVKEA